jgi:C1A family cysteine protease
MRRSMRYGRIPDLGDARDKRLKLMRPGLVVPSHVDLRAQCAPVFDQGDLGSCTGNAWAAAFEFDLVKQKAHVFRPSRLQIYYDERALEGSVDYDSGAQIRDGAKALAATGVCPEYMWPYDPNQFDVKPTVTCYKEAAKHQILTYWRMTQSAIELQASLAAGYPVVFGFTVYESFESSGVTHSGIVQMPNLDNESVVGGHAVMLVGYDNPTMRWIVRNSWGPDWGMKGYFTMPYEYLLSPDLASDFWTLRRVEM